MTPVDTSIPPQAEWDDDVMREHAERDWKAFQRALEWDDYVPRTFCEALRLRARKGGDL